jgi:hypothetical protein
VSGLLNAPGHAEAQQDAILRYSRLQICATGRYGALTTCGCTGRPDVSNYCNLGSDLAFSLTPALSRRERVKRTPRLDNEHISPQGPETNQQAFHKRTVTFSVSQRERAGVRENAVLPKAGCKKLEVSKRDLLIENLMGNLALCHFRH